MSSAARNAEDELDQVCREAEAAGKHRYDPYGYSIYSTDGSPTRPGYVELSAWYADALLACLNVLQPGRWRLHELDAPWKGMD